MMSLAPSIRKTGVVHACLWMSPRTLVCRSFAQFAADAGTEKRKDPSFYERLNSHLSLSQKQRNVWGVEYASRDNSQTQRKKTNVDSATINKSRKEHIADQSFHEQLSTHLSFRQRQRKVWGVEYVSHMRRHDNQDSANHSERDADRQ